MSLFSSCKHTWEIKDKTITESAIEMLKRIELVPKESFGFMFKKKYITIMTCSKCGKIDKTIEDC